jgi:tetratricopeptide (TPR) repeat protein
MPEDRSAVPPPTPEQRRAAVGMYERAQQVIAKGDFDYAIDLMVSCCKIDPANLIYRRLLRQLEKSKYKNNLRGSRLAFITSSPAKARMRSAKRARDYLKVLEHGEEVLRRNPWDTRTQMDMADAADAVGLIDVAVWNLEQARQKDPKDVKVNRSLARLYEKRGNFTLAIALWEMVRSVDPTDLEARHKSKDLAATDTINRGQYEQVVTGETPSPRVSASDISLPDAPRPSGDPASDRMLREAQPLRAKIEADPTNVAAYLNLAAVYRRADRLDEARAVLEEGRGPTANHFDIASAIADLDVESFRKDLTQTEARLREKPNDPELRQLRSQLRKEIDTRELDLFRQRADRYPNEKPYRFEVGVRLLRLGQVDEAIRELQSLRGDARLQWKVLTYLGYCFLNRNNWRLAQRNFEEALQTLPPNEEETRKDLLYQLAVGNAGAGDLARAVDLGHDLANIDFGYRDINRLLDEWQSKLQGA